MDRVANETGRVVVNAKRGVSHPQWDSTAVKNDIAIVYLTSPVYTSSELIKIIRSY
jgi:hypothetical protein